VDSDALDAHGNLFVGYGDQNGVGRIDEFKKGSTHPMQLGMAIGYTGGMEIDNSNDILVADPDFFNGHNQPAVDIFKMGSIFPEFQFDEEGWPYYVAITKSEHHVYVSDALLSQIREYSYPGGVLINTITKGLENGNYPVGVAVDPPAPL
jgi:DNA-binding beta-propeller fold protein YncE